MSGSVPHASPLRDRHRHFAEAEGQRTPVLRAEERTSSAVEGLQASTGHRVAIELEYLPYAAPDAPIEAGPACELVAAYGPIEVEYAAIRRGAALVDAAQRGTVLVTGSDRRAFLQRMVTQDLAGLTSGAVRRSFWLNRKGRIDADLVLAELGSADGAPSSDDWRGQMIIDVDRTRAAHVAQSLTGFLFSEAVELSDRSLAFHHLELHGPAAGRMLALAGATAIPARDEARATLLGGVPVVLIRNDLLGETGWSIIVERTHVGELWDALLRARDPHDERKRVRPIGWHAYNIARVEAGSPLFHIDFGPTNLPHESGVLADRVSFKKGCYLGQEVVARMQSLGKPKQMLVGLRPTQDLLPVAGAQVFAAPPQGSQPGGEQGSEPGSEQGSEPAGTIGEQVGSVTSSTLAPMLSAQPIAFAMVRTSHAVDGTTLIVNGEGSQCPAIVGPLRSWPPESRRPSEGEGSR